MGLADLEGEPMSKKVPFSLEVWIAKWTLVLAAVMVFLVLIGVCEFPPVVWE